MKFIDWTAQTFILVMTAGGVLFDWIEDGSLNRAWGALLWGQLFLGIWQFFSCLISAMTRLAYHGKKKWHLLISIGYLLLLFAGASTDSFGLNLPDWINLFFLMVPAWCLGIWYYSITWKWTFQGKSQGKFLTHIGF